MYIMYNVYNGPNELIKARDIPFSQLKLSLTINHYFKSRIFCCSEPWLLHNCK